MKWPMILVVVVACVGEEHPTPKTADSMRAYRVSHSRCRRMCPVGQSIDDLDNHKDPLADCCVDPNGIGWSSCAWNGSGQYMTWKQLMAAPLPGCGGDGYPDCNQ